MTGEKVQEIMESLKEKFTESELGSPVSLETALASTVVAISAYADAQRETDDIIFNGLYDMLDKLAGRMNDDLYHNVRFQKFCLQAIAELSGTPKKAVLDQYEKWCKEFDRLNKGGGKD